MTDQLVCLQAGGTTACAGEVRLHARSQTSVAFPRCDAHWVARQDAELGIGQRYPEIQPDDFDPRRGRRILGGTVTRENKILPVDRQTFDGVKAALGRAGYDIAHGHFSGEALDMRGRHYHGAAHSEGDVMEIKDLPDWTAEGIRWSVTETGSTDFHRVFVRVDGVTIGRLCFMNGQYSHPKWYKPGDIRTFDSSDYVAAKWEKFVRGEQLTRAEYDVLVKRATKQAAERLAELQAARARLPPLGLDKEGRPKHRKRLEGPNPRHELFRLLNPDMAAQ